MLVAGPMQCLNCGSKIISKFCCSNRNFRQMYYDDEDTEAQIGSASEQEIREEIFYSLSLNFADSYNCTRDWSAWHYKTMTENDFEEISDVYIGEVVDYIMDRLNEKFMVKL